MFCVFCVLCDPQGFKTQVIADSIETFKNAFDDVENPVPEKKATKR